MSVRQALAPLFKTHQPVVARSFSPQTLKETILYLRTEIAGIKELQAKRRLQIRKAKADGKSVSHLERANSRAEKDLATFEKRLLDFKARAEAPAQSKELVPVKPQAPTRRPK